MRKQKPIAEFASLTLEQRNQLYRWFEHGYTYDQLCAKVAQPSPDGFALKVSRGKMFRYYHQWQDIRALNKEDNLITVEAFQSFLEGDPGQLTAESIHRIKAQAFVLTPLQNDPGKLYKLLQVFDFERSRYLAERRIYFKERAQELSARRMQLASAADQAS